MTLNREGVELEISALARDFLSKAWPISAVRETLPYTPLPRDLWSQAEGMGWFALLSPEHRGGLGLGPVEAGAVFEEAGRSLFPGPLFDTMVVATRVLPADIAAPSAVVSFAYAEADSVGQPTFGARVRRGKVTGVKTHVSHADHADTIIVLAEMGGLPAFVTVDGQSIDDLVVEESIDCTTRPCTVRFDGSSAEVLLVGEEAVAGLRALTRLAVCLSASRILGAADRLLEMAVGYAQEREQFGRPIGSFQAVRHRLADIRVRTTALRSACYRAQVMLAADDENAGHVARIAKAFASRAGRQIAESALQVHGGIGFTVDHDLHLYFKHILSLQAAWGDERHHRLVLADAVIRRTSATRSVDPP